MKNLFRGLLVAAFALFILPANAEDFKDLITSSNRAPQPISKQQVDQMRARLRAMYQSNAGSRALDVNLNLDYFTCEEEAAINDGYDWQQFIWPVNRNWPPVSALTFDWVMTDFYSYHGYDADDANATCLEYDINFYTLDSVFFAFTYENTTSSVDTLIVTVYADDWNITSQGPSGTITPATTTLWTETYISGVDFTSGPPNQLQEFIATTALNFTAGETFAVRVDFIGDTSNTFTLLAGYRDECADSEVASENVIVPLNSIYYINADSVGPNGTLNLTGINSVGFDPSLTCSEFYTQNWWMVPFISANVNFTADIVANATAGCDGDVIALQASASGGAGPLTYAWSTTSGTLTTNSGSSPSLVLGSSNANVKVTVSDGSASVVDSITITSNSINVTLPSAIDIDCGDDSLLIAQVSGNLAGVQYSWTGPNGTRTTPTYTVDNPGSVSVTVTNASGCTADDNATVTILGVSQVVNFTIRNVAAGINDSTCYQIDQPVQLTNTSAELTGWEFEWDYTEGQTSVANPIVTFQATGNNVEVTLTATQVGNTSCVISSTKTIIVLPALSCVVGIKESYLNSLIEMYPNPTNGEFTINFTDLANENVNIDIYNLQGKRVFSNNVYLTGNDFETVDLSNNANGMYLIRIQVGNDVLSKTITLNK